MPRPLEELEQQAREIGKVIGKAVPPKVGFCLVLFDFGEPHTGHMTYVSNGNRQDVLTMMRELQHKMGGDN